MQRKTSRACLTEDGGEEAGAGRRGGWSVMNGIAGLHLNDRQPRPRAMGLDILRASHYTTARRRNWSGERIIYRYALEP